MSANAGCPERVLRITVYSFQSRGSTPQKGRLPVCLGLGSLSSPQPVGSLYPPSTALPATSWGAVVPGFLPPPLASKPVLHTPLRPHTVWGPPDSSVLPPCGCGGCARRGECWELLERVSTGPLPPQPSWPQTPGSPHPSAHSLGCSP